MPGHRRRFRRGCGDVGDHRMVDLAVVLEGLAQLGETDELRELRELAELDELAELRELDELAYYDPDDDPFHHPHPEL